VLEATLLGFRSQGRQSARSFAALLIAGQKALGKRFGGSDFYERVEKDLAFGASCARIFTTAIRRVYIAVFSAHLRAIRYFDCRELFVALRRIVRQRQWRFAKSTDPRIVRWALGDPVEE